MNTHRIRSNGTIKNTESIAKTGQKQDKPVQPQATSKCIDLAESTAIGRLTSLTKKQIKALAYLAEWKRINVAGYCKIGLTAIFQSSLDDMQTLAQDESRTPEKVRAAEFLSLVAPLFPRRRQITVNTVPADAPSAKPVQSESPSFKHPCDILAPNGDIRIDLTEAEVRSLVYFRNKFMKRKDQSLAYVAHLILLLALAHPDFIQRALNNAVDYLRNEGIKNEWVYLVGRVSAHSTYRNVRAAT